MPTDTAAIASAKAAINTVQSRLGALQLSRRVGSDAVVSEPFMRDHTAFDSFAAFVEASPWSPSDPGAIRDVPRGALDDYVAATTDFETWAELRTRAAEEALIEHHLF